MRQVEAAAPGQQELGSTDGIRHNGDGAAAGEYPAAIKPAAAADYGSAV